jgi:hypothetical protein
MDAAYRATDLEEDRGRHRDILEIATSTSRREG